MLCVSLANQLVFADSDDYQEDSEIELQGNVDGKVYFLGEIYGILAVLEVGRLRRVAQE